MRKPDPPGLAWPSQQEHVFMGRGWCAGLTAPPPHTHLQHSEGVFGVRPVCDGHIEAVCLAQIKVLELHNSRGGQERIPTKGLAHHGLQGARALG